MLSSPPWSSLGLKVVLLTKQAKELWDDVRRAGAEAFTDTQWRKVLAARPPPLPVASSSRNNGDGEDDAWGARGDILDRTTILTRLDGVEGARQTQADDNDEASAATDGDETFKANDGASLFLASLRWQFADTCPQWRLQTSNGLNGRHVQRASRGIIVQSATRRSTPPCVPCVSQPAPCDAC